MVAGRSERVGAAVVGLLLAAVLASAQQPDVVVASQQQEDLGIPTSWQTGADESGGALSWDESAIELAAAAESEWQEFVSTPFTDDGGVQQVHVSLAPQLETPGAIVVSFASSTHSTEAGVHYAEEGSNGSPKFAPERVTSYEHTTEENNGTYVSPYLYHALIEEVSTNRTVLYEPVLEQTLRSERELTRQVRVPPLASAFGGDPSQGMRLALIGDLGQTSNSIQTMRHLAQEIEDDQLAALLIMGDLSYADNLDERWDDWGRMFEPVLERIPMFGLPGNHEIETDSADGVEFRPYAHRFQNMPNCKNGCGGFDDKGWKANMWHSFDLGSAHIVHVSSYHPYEQGTPQYMWLDRDLKSVDREKTPWVIVNLHAPWYNSNVAHQGEWQSTEVRKTWQPLLCDARVNIMFAGHVHSYERIHPTCSNATVNYVTGVTHVNIGEFLLFLLGSDVDPDPCQSKTDAFDFSLSRSIRCDSLLQGTAATGRVSTTTGSPGRTAGPGLSGAPSERGATGTAFSTSRMPRTPTGSGTGTTTARRRRGTPLGSSTTWRSRLGGGKRTRSERPSSTTFYRSASAHSHWCSSSA